MFDMPPYVQVPTAIVQNALHAAQQQVPGAAALSSQERMYRQIGQAAVFGATNGYPTNSGR